MPALALVLLMFGQATETPAEREAAIAFLHSLQQADSGGFIARKARQGEPTPQPSLRTSRTALRAYRLRDSAVKDRDGVIRFVKGCYDEKSGGFADRPGIKPDPISTSVALMALIELKLPTEPYVDGTLKFMSENTRDFEDIRMVAAGLEAVDRTVPEAKKWLEMMHSERNADGTFGKGTAQVRSTALHVVAELRLRSEPMSRDHVLKFLRASQQADGGWPGEKGGASDSECCYRVMRCFSKLDALPERVPELHKFIASCRNADGGYGIKPQEPSTVQGTYYASVVRYFAAGGK